MLGILCCIVVIVLFWNGRVDDVESVFVCWYVIFISVGKGRFFG